MAQPIPVARISVLIADVTIFPSKLAFHMVAIAKIAGWVQARLSKGGMPLNLSKSNDLFLGEVETGNLAAYQRADLERTGLTITETEMGQVPKHFTKEVAMREAAELQRVLAKMEDVEARFQITRLSASTRLTYLVHKFPPRVGTGAAEHVDAILEILEWMLPP